MPTWLLCLTNPTPALLRPPPSPTRAKSQECKPRFAVTLIPRYTHASKDLLQDGSGSTSPSAKTKKGCKPGQGKKVKKHVTKASLLHCLSLYYIAIPSGGLTGRPKPKRSQQPRPHRRQLPPQQQQAHPRTHGFEARPLRTPNCSSYARLIDFNVYC